MAIINIEVSESTGIAVSVGTNTPIAVNVAQSDTIAVALDPLEPTNIEMVVGQGPAGPPGSVGPISETVSTDASNALTLGTDDKFYVPLPQLASAQW